MTTKKQKAFRAVDVLEKEFGPFTFAGFIRAARTMKDMNQTEMAKFLGFSKGTLCDIEKGRQLVSPELAAKIARKCGMSEVLAVQTALEDLLRRAKLKMHVSVSAAA